MDEDRLTEVFREAADRAGHTAPPAGFDHADVLAGSARATRRAHHRRMGAVAAAVLVVAAGGLISAEVLHTTSSTAAAPDATPPGTMRSEDAPGAAAGPSSAGKRAAGDSCAVADPELFAQLGELLPAVRGATPRPLGDNTYCPDGGRGVEVDVNDGDARGTLRVLLSPPDSVGGGSSIQTGGGSMSTDTVSVRGGGSLSLTTRSSEGGAPYEDELDDLADELAHRNAH
jgi:hypothetical protein